MILADCDIKKYVRAGKIKISPEPDWKKALGSCSLDLRLGSSSKTLNPGEFVLASTLEYIQLPDHLCGILHGRSSLGRKGLMIHSTAPLFDAGFAGKVVMELFNAGSEVISLKTGQRICAMSFEQLTSPAKIPYYKKKGAKYFKQ